MLPLLFYLVNIVLIVIDAIITIGFTRWDGEGI